MSDQAVIADLARKVAALEGRVAVLERRPLPVTRTAPPPIVEEEGARILRPLRTVAGLLPDAADRKALTKIVLSRFPKLGPDLSSPRGDEMAQAFDLEIESAIAALGTFGRSDAVDVKHYAAHWYDEANEYLRAAGLTTVTFNAWLVSLLSWGDIAHNFDQAQQHNGVSLAVGLAPAGGGRPADPQAWRTVLKTGSLRAPSPPPPAARKPPVTHQVLVTGGNTAVGAGRIDGW